MNRAEIRVKQWLADKINAEARSHHIYLIFGGKPNGYMMTEHDVIRVEQIISETEKAYHVLLDAENSANHYQPWDCWIPKSQILEMVCEVN